MHRGTSPRHGDVKLCFVRLPKRPNRHVDDDLVDSLGLTRALSTSTDGDDGAKTMTRLLEKDSMAVTASAINSVFPAPAGPLKRL
jgi:hypothetical protein